VIALEVGAFLLGIFIVLGTWGSVLRTLVIPRGYASRLSVFVGRTLTRGFFIRIAKLRDTYEGVDKILAFTAPMALLTTLAVWLTLFVLGFGLIMWSLLEISFPGALREAGSSVFTLGFATTARTTATVVDIFAAATGLLVVALEIAYLPVLYSAFNRRETLVTTLQSRAGSPAWGPEILARHQLVGSLDNLRAFYAEWEVWAADLAESHANYTVLIWFRSPHPYRSWVLALLSVMDSAALYNALNPSSAPSEARMAIRMGFTSLRDIAAAIGIPFDPDPFPDDPIDLTYEDFMDGIERLRDLDFPMERTPEDAWAHFKGWRVNYEAIVYALADVTNSVPGPWSGPRSLLDGITIEPQRPANRRPEDPEGDSVPRGRRGF
jgi:hypothetical protein